jgi:hypothetical protein
MIRTEKLICDWIEREVERRFPDKLFPNDEVIPAGQLRVRVSKLCFDLVDELRSRDAGFSLVQAPDLSLPTARDRERLAIAARVLLLGEPETLEEVRLQLDDLHDAICALQSTDNLGSLAANQKASVDMFHLQEKYERLKKRLRPPGRQSL